MLKCVNQNITFHYLRKRISGTFARYDSLSNPIERRIIVAEISRAFWYGRKQKNHGYPYKFNIQERKKVYRDQYCISYQK